MAKTLNEFESEIQPLMRDTTSGSVTTDAIKSSLNRCIDSLRKDHGVYSTKKRQPLALYATVEEYPLPTDFFDIIALQKNETPRNYLRTKPEAFYQTSGDVLSVDSQGNKHWLLVKAREIAATQIINACESVTANGTWALEAGTDAVNVVTDTLNEKVGSGAISFDVTVGASGNDYAAIDNDDMTAVDLTDFVGKGVVFTWVYIPSVTNLTSFTLRFGSSTANYYSQTVTAQYNGSAFVVGWNRLGFASASATETGTVVDTAIDYLNFRVTYTSSYTSQTGFILDDVRICNPYLMELKYYSTHFVIDSTGVSKEYFESASDASLLDEADDNVLMYFALSDAFWILREYNDKEAAELRYREEVGKLKTRFGSEKKREVTFYR